MFFFVHVLSVLGIDCQIFSTGRQVGTRASTCSEGREYRWVLSRVWGLTHDSSDRGVLSSHCRPLTGDGALPVPGRRGVSQ